MTSSVPPGEVEAARPSDGVVPAGPQGHPADGRSVPEEQKDIPPTAGVPVIPEVTIPGPDKNRTRVLTLFNNMCAHYSLSQRQVDSIPDALEGEFLTKPLEILVKAVRYMKTNPGFKDLSWSIKTLVENAERYAQLWDEFYGPQAKTKTTASGPQDAPKYSGKPKTAQVIPEEIQPAWERLQALQAQVELPDTKLHGNDWKVLIAEATPKVSADDIAVRYEARICACMAEGKEMQYWPSLRTFIKNGDHLLPPAKVSTKSKASSTSTKALSRAEREIRNQREAGGGNGWDSTTDSSSVLDAILGDRP